MVFDARGHNTRAGTEIRLFTKGTKSLLGTGIVETGSGYNAQSVMPVHFGLPINEPVDIEITSMTNSGRKSARLENVDPKQYTGSYLKIKVNLEGEIVK